MEAEVHEQVARRMQEEVMEEVGEVVVVTEGQEVQEGQEVVVVSPCR